MYLSDGEIRSRLPELDISTDDDHPFDADAQIQPCSIDLRLSPVYWKPKRGLKRPIDLSRSRLLEVNPRRYWNRYTLADDESMTIRPGELVLARVYEQITIPSDCAGAVEGRSSFARMGLSVHSTGGFINPGWRGHMPLTLVNDGPTALRIPPYLAICQLMLVQVSSHPNRTYGSETLRSKYVDDDGGPSYWWRDQVLGRLLDRLGQADVTPDLQARLLNRIGAPSDEVLERLEELVGRMPANRYGNVDDLLQDFIAREDRKRMQDTLFRRVAIGFTPVMASAAIGAPFVRPIGILHYIIWALTLLCVPISVLALRSGPRSYFGEIEFREMNRARATGQTG